MLVQVRLLLPQALATNTSACRLIWLGHSEDRIKYFLYGCAAIGSRLVLGTRFVVSSSLTTHIKLTGGLSNWLARRPVKPLPAGHVGSSPSPPIRNTNFTFPSNSVGLECHLYTLEVGGWGGSNPSSGTTFFERMVAQLAEVMVLETIKCEFESHSSDKLSWRITPNR